MKLSAIALLFAAVAIDSSEAVKVVQRTVSRSRDDDDEQEGAKKVSELDQIMNRYEDDEKHDAYVKSP